MPRYKLTIEYDGTPFCGWQMQADQPTVQGVLTAAITALSGESRARAGRRPHRCRRARARAGGACRSAEDWDPDTVRDALNAHLRPHPVAVLAAERVADDFNARTSAVQAALPLSHPQPARRSGARAGRAWRVPRPLDAEAMHAAAQRLIGKHDFTTFRAAECQAKSPVKTLDRLDVARDGEDVIVLASARSFLHSQVRSMVGSLVPVGEGKWTRRRSSALRSTRATAPLRSAGAAGRALSDAGGLLRSRCRPKRRRERSTPQLRCQN